VKAAICSLFNHGRVGGNLWNVPDPYLRGHTVVSEDLAGCFPASIEDVTFDSCSLSIPSRLYAVRPFDCGVKVHSKIVALLAFANAAKGRLTRLKRVTFCCTNPSMARKWVVMLSEAFSAIGVQLGVIESFTHL
jgi:hypothetical protein